MRLNTSGCDLTHGPSIYSQGRDSPSHGGELPRSKGVHQERVNRLRHHTSLLQAEIKNLKLGEQGSSWHPLDSQRYNWDFEGRCGSGWSRIPFHCSASSSLHGEPQRACLALVPGVRRFQAWMLRFTALPLALGSLRPLTLNLKPKR